MWYLAIFMAPHLKQQERSNGVWGLAGRGRGVTNIFVIYLGGGREIFSKGIGGGGGSSNGLPTT